MTLGADIPAWVTVAVAGITALAALAGSIIAGRSQDRAAATQARTAHVMAREDRFADWQLHKRDVYADLLLAARSWDVADASAKTAFLCQRDRALLVANEQLRDRLRVLSDPPWDDAAWAEFTELLNADARQDKAAT